MSCKHAIGQQRGGSLRIDGCGSRTGARGDRVQRVGFGGSANSAEYQADCMDLQGSAAVYASS